MKRLLALVAVLCCCAVGVQADGGRWQAKKTNGTGLGLYVAADDTLTVAGTLDLTGTWNLAPSAALKLSFVDTTVTANTSGKLVVTWNLNDKNDLGMCDWVGSECNLRSTYQEFRADEHNGSYVRDDADWLPTHGMGIATDGGDSVRIYNRLNLSAGPVITLEPGANNCLQDASPVVTDLAFLDGVLGIAGSGGADLTFVDFRLDKAYKFDTGGWQQYNGALSACNSGSGWTVLSSSPAIVNATVYALAMQRSPFSGLAGVDEVGRQRLLWVVGTAGGMSASRYDATGTMYIYDSALTSPFPFLRMLPNGSIYGVYDETGVQDHFIWYYSIFSKTADAFAHNHVWNNATAFAEDIRWGTPAVYSAAAALPGLSGSGNNSPRIYAAADSGLYILDAKAGDNTKGSKQEINASRGVRPLIYAGASIAFSSYDSHNDANAAVPWTLSGLSATSSASSPSGSYVANAAGTAYGVIYSANAPNAVTLLTSYVWFTRSTDTGTLEIIFGRYELDSTRGWSLSINSSDQLEGRVHDGTLKTITGPTITADTNWHLAGLTYDGATVYLYLDGVLVGSASATGDVTDDGYDLCLYCHWTAGALVTNIYEARGRIAFAVLDTTSAAPASFFANAYARALPFIESPTPDTLMTGGDVDKARAHRGLVYLVDEATVEVRSVSGALIDTLKCTGCGTIYDVAPWPESMDSLAVVIVGSGGYRTYVPDPLVVDLARDYASEFRGIGSGPIIADTAGYGHTWTIGDAVGIAANVGIPVIDLTRGTYAENVVLAAPITIRGVGDTLSVIDGGITGHAVSVTGADVVAKDVGAKTTKGGGTAYDAWNITGARFTGVNLRALGSDDDCFYLDAVHASLMGIRGNRCDDEGVETGTSFDKSLISNLLIKDQVGTSLQLVSGADNNTIMPAKLDGAPTDAGTSNQIIYNDTAD